MVHRLEDQEHRPSVLRVEALLEVGELQHALLELPIRLLGTPEGAGIAGVVAIEPVGRSEGGKCGMRD